MTEQISNSQNKQYHTNNYNITFSINRSYLLFAMITLYSLLKNNSKYYFDIYILHNACLQEEEINKIVNQYPLKQFSNFKVHLVDVSHIKELEELKIIGNWSKEIYFKVFLPDLLPQVDKILHLDVDVIVRGDIKKLLDTNMENYLFLGDGNCVENQYYYINVGIMLCNLEQERRLGFSNKLFKYMLDNNKQENEAVNAFPECSRTTEGNYIYTTASDAIIEKREDVRLVHYTIPKPWNLNQMQTMKQFKKKYIDDYYTYYQDFVEAKYKLNFKIYYWLLKCGLPVYYSVARRLLNWYQKKTKQAKRTPKFVMNKLYKYASIKAK